MDKNWLIRTKSNHILGPISKEKVLELFHNGSIKPDDEVASGNGFWFYIREDDMVAKYLLGNEHQGFNPISEAKDVLTGTATEALPHDPDDITLVSGINLSSLADGPPTTPSSAISEVQKESPTEIKKKNSSEVKTKGTHKVSSKKEMKSQGYLKFLGILGFILLFCLVYFRKTIIRSLFEGEITLSIPISLINEVHAQEDIPAKKKSF